MHQTLKYVRQQVISMCRVTLWHIKFRAKHAQSNSQTMLQRTETFLIHLNSPLCVIPNKDTTNRCACSQVHDSVCQPTLAYSPMESKHCHHLTLCSNIASWWHLHWQYKTCDCYVLYHICSTLNSKKCVHLCIYDLFHTLLSLWHKDLWNNWMDGYIHLCVSVCVCARTRVHCVRRGVWKTVMRKKGCTDGRHVRTK
jgi:hypothetical protein